MFVAVHGEHSIRTFKLNLSRRWLSLAATETLVQERVCQSLPCCSKPNRHRLGRDSGDKFARGTHTSIIAFKIQDDPCTNAGLGSNLTIDGNVECDASVMEGDGSFGAVGAVPCRKILKSPLII